MRPEAKVVKAKKRTIVRNTSQPGFIEAYEQTSIYPKILGFIDKWNLDIGDKISVNKPLAHLDVPDLFAEYDEKKTEVELSKVARQGLSADGQGCGGKPEKCRGPGRGSQSEPGQISGRGRVLERRLPTDS